MSFGKIRVPAQINQRGDAWRLSKSDAKEHYEINRDIDDMIKYAQPARKAGRNAIQGYMAIANMTKQGRSNIFPPTIHAMVYSRMAMEAANIPNVQYKHRLGASEPKMKWINAARKNAEQGDGNMRPHSVHLWMNQNFDKILFGVGFRYLSYLLQTRIVRIKDSNGKTIEKKITVYDDIWDQNLDFFHVGVSRDMLPGMFQGRACYFDLFFPKSAFLERYDNEYHMNMGVVKNSKWFKETDFVRVRHYYDIYKDKFYLQACQKDPFEGGDEYCEYSYCIRNDFIQDYGQEDRPEKFLPVTSIHNDINFDMKQESEFNILQAGRQYADVANPTSNKTFWSKSDPYLVRALVGAKNVMWRAGIDNAKASTVNFLLTQSTGIYDQVKTADLYGVVPIRSADNKTFDVKSMLANSDFLAKWQGADDMIDAASIYALGNDYKRIATDLTNEKATIAAIKNNLQQIRGKNNMKFNESGPIPRHYNILLNLMQQYYPEQVMIELAGDPLPEGLKEKDIVRDADGKVVGYYEPKMIPFDEQVVELVGTNPDGTEKYRIVSEDHPDAKGKESMSMIPARKEHICTKEKPEIYVDQGSTFYEMKALEKSMELEKVQAYQFFFGLSYPSDEKDPMTGAPIVKPLISRDGAEYILKNFAEVMEDEPDKLFPVESEEEALPKQIQTPFAFAQGQLPPVPNQSPQQTIGMSQGANTSGVNPATPAAMAANLRTALTP